MQGEFLSHLCVAVRGREGRKSVEQLTVCSLVYTIAFLPPMLHRFLNEANPSMGQTWTVQLRSLCSCSFLIRCFGATRIRVEQA